MKNYYVYAHKKLEKMVCRRQFIKSCLDTEILMYRWIYLISAEVESLEENDPTLVNVKCLPVTNSDEVEFHVDYHELLFELNNEKYDFYDCVTFQKSPNQKLLIYLEHDEAIAKQCSFATKSWTTPDGEKGLMPKDEGCGIMASTFAFRKLGFSMKITATELNRAIAYRDGKNHQDNQAEIGVIGADTKKMLKVSPFYHSSNIALERMETVTIIRYGFITKIVWTV